MWTRRTSPVKPWSGCTALHEASSYGKYAYWQLDKVKYLIDQAGMDVNKTDNDGLTALHYAARIGNNDVVRYLVEQAKADAFKTDNAGQTALHLAAAWCKDVDTVRYLVEQAEVGVEITDNNGRTALHCTTAKARYGVIEYLSEKERVQAGKKNHDGQIWIFAMLCPESWTFSDVEVVQTAMREAVGEATVNECVAHATKFIAGAGHNRNEGAMDDALLKLTDDLKHKRDERSILTTLIVTAKIVSPIRDEENGGTPEAPAANAATKPLVQRLKELETTCRGECSSGHEKALGERLQLLETLVFGEIGTEGTLNCRVNKLETVVGEITVNLGEVKKELLGSGGGAEDLSAFGLLALLEKECCVPEGECEGPLCLRTANIKEATG